MSEIKSVSNELIKKIAKLHQKKFRNEYNLFILEGVKSVQEALFAGIKIEHIFVLSLDTAQKKIKNEIYDVGEFSSDDVICVSEAVMKKISTTENVPEILAVAQMPKQRPIKGNKIALFENIKDAGNLGTIIRSAAAFNIDMIVLAGDSIDVYNPKVIRSAAGNFFKVPVKKIETLDELSGYMLIATVVEGGIEEANFQKPFVLMFGSEASGLSSNLLDAADVRYTLKTSEKTESLNLSVAASIIFYKIFSTT